MTYESDLSLGDVYYEKNKGDGSFTKEVVTSIPFSFKDRDGSIVRFKEYPPDMIESRRIARIASEPAIVREKPMVFVRYGKTVQRDKVLAELRKQHIAPGYPAYIAVHPAMPYILASKRPFVHEHFVLKTKVQGVHLVDGKLQYSFLGPNPSERVYYQPQFEEVFASYTEARKHLKSLLERIPCVKKVSSIRIPTHTMQDLYETA